MGMNLIAGLWGFAEATLFFIVPDVWLSVMAVRRGARAALAGCLFAAAGALAGGAVMYGWGKLDPRGIAAVLAAVPAIDADMVAGVRAGLVAQGGTAMILGAFSGIPYKIYAATAADAGLGPWFFLAVSVPARLLRFVAVALVVAAVSKGIAPWVALKGRLALLFVLWTVLYAFYFAQMPG